MNEGKGYVHGNLGHDWSEKQANGTTIWENSVAYEPDGKKGETIWVSLSLWPSRDGDDSEAQAIVQGSGKGSKVLLYGNLKLSNFTDKNTGQARSKWQMTVWRCGSELRPDNSGAATVTAAFPGATQYTAKEMEPF